MTRRLAEALGFDRDPVSVAVLDLRFQRAAGDSLRRWNRRRPPRVAVQRVYEQARAVLDAEDAERRAQADEAGMFVAKLLDGLTTHRSHRARARCPLPRRGRVGGRGCGAERAM